MLGGILVTFIGCQFILKNPAPLFVDTFQLDNKTGIDKPLLIGAITFGGSWGLVSYCPGPAIACLSYGFSTTLLFVPMMIIGLLLARYLTRFSQNF